MEDTTVSSHEDAWRKSISGRIYTRLEEIAAREKMDLSIEEKGSPIEVILFGPETARIVKHLNIGSIDDVDGVLTTSVEGHEYKRKPWWKEAIDAEGIPVQFLDTPVALAAKDAEIAEWETIFRPSRVVKKYKLANGKTETALQEAEEWVRDTIANYVSSAVTPDFDVEYSDFLLRLVPKITEAEESRTTDNEVYAATLEKIRSVVPLLEQAYKSKSKN